MNTLFAKLKSFKSKINNNKRNSCLKYITTHMLSCPDIIKSKYAYTKGPFLNTQLISFSFGIYNVMVSFKRSKM